MNAPFTQRSHSESGEQWLGGEKKTHGGRSHLQMTSAAWSCSQPYRGGLSEGPMGHGSTLPVASCISKMPDLPTPCQAIPCSV